MRDGSCLASSYSKYSRGFWEDREKFGVDAYSFWSIYWSRVTSIFCIVFSEF